MKLPRNDEIIFMVDEKQYCIYILTNANNRVLYTGVTNNIERRVLEHRSGKGGAFTSKYKVVKLVYFECGSSNKEAVFREKQIKAGSRKKKIALIEKMNPEWKDLYDELFL